MTERSEGPTERSEGVCLGGYENFEKLDAFSCILIRCIFLPTIEAVMKSVLSVICPEKIVHPRF